MSVDLVGFVILVGHFNGFGIENLNLNYSKKGALTFLCASQIINGFKDAGKMSFFFGF